MSDGFRKTSGPQRRGGGTPHNGVYGEAPPEMGPVSRPRVYKRVAFSQGEANERVQKSVI